MITVDSEKCTQCGICVTNFKAFCINEKNGVPVVDYRICNRCQKCIALCPQQAITMNEVAPQKIADVNKLSYDELISFLSLRRSTKKFIRKDISADIIQKIARSAEYAPNQNKNIDVLIINDPYLIKAIDVCALKFVKRLYHIMFSFKPITCFIGLFSRSLPVVKKKMERDLLAKKGLLKKTQMFFC